MTMRYLSIVVCMLAATGLTAQPHSAHEVLVRFKRGQQQQLKAGAEVNGCSVCTHYQSLSQRTGKTLVHLRDPNRSTEELVQLFAQDPSVEFVEPNYLRYTSISQLPNDSNFAQQWGLNNSGQIIQGSSGITDSDTDWAEARRLSSDAAPEVIVGIIDTGVDIQHQDLIGNLFFNPGEIAGNGIDDDNNGYIDDVNGYDFSGDFGAPPDADPADIDDHGTHVSGIAAAVSNNGRGVAGVAQAKILPLKASPDFNANGFFLTNAAVLAAMDYAVMMKQRGFNIVAINGSYGSNSFSQSEETAMQALADAGIIFVAAAGNENANNDITNTYPANYTTGNVISVAATTNRDQRASFSNFGASSVDIGAPGLNIFSTVRASYPSTLSVNNVAYVSRAMTYSGIAGPITRPLINCGLGGPGDFPPGVAGNIALIERGTFFFSEKVRNAQNAGAVAAIIYDNTADSAIFGGTLQYLTDWIPAISVTQATGQTLSTLAGQQASISVSMDEGSAYGFISGTSMAAPMVTGAIAVLAQHYPNDSVAERIQRLYSNSDSVTALNGLVVSGRRMNLRKALDADEDLVPDWFEAQILANSDVTEVNASSDSDGDGSKDLLEFRAGTNPTDPQEGFQITETLISNGSELSISFPSAPGRSYLIYGTTSLDQPFTLYRSSIPATPPENRISLPIENDAFFYRVDIDWPE